MVNSVYAKGKDYECLPSNKICLLWENCPFSLRDYNFKNFRSSEYPLLKSNWNQGKAYIQIQTIPQLLKISH